MAGEGGKKVVGCWAGGMMDALALAWRGERVVLGRRIGDVLVMSGAKALWIVTADSCVVGWWVGPLDMDGLGRINRGDMAIPQSCVDGTCLLTLLRE
jgi:hypothetical protein